MRLGQHAIAAAGDKLQDIMERALRANDDAAQLRQILKNEGQPALREWDLARGRAVPSQYDFSPPESAATR